ncbi:hypothetical protein D9M71_548700 [compost metagenome]
MFSGLPSSASVSPGITMNSKRRTPWGNAADTYGRTGSQHRYTFGVPSGSLAMSITIHWLGAVLPSKAMSKVRRIRLLPPSQATR